MSIGRVRLIRHTLNFDVDLRWVFKMAEDTRALNSRGVSVELLARA